MIDTYTLRDREERRAVSFGYERFESQSSSSSAGLPAMHGLCADINTFHAIPSLVLGRSELMMFLMVCFVVPTLCSAFDHRNRTRELPVRSAQSNLSPACQYLVEKA